MKSFSWLALTQYSVTRAVAIALVLVVLGACTEEAITLNASSNGKGGGGANMNLKSNNGTTNNSQSSAADYRIDVSSEGKVWTYVITLCEGAKGVSHFILDLENCPEEGASSTIDNILWAKVNGVDAVLAASEGNTGCNVSSVTSNIVKFDDLEDAKVYTIVFELNQEFHNFLTTTAWIKAGNSCHAYEVLAPCCPF
jgi:hypothetical protein